LDTGVIAGESIEVLFELSNRAADLPIVSSLDPSSEALSSEPPSVIEELKVPVELCGRDLSFSGLSMIAPPSATVYLFLGVGLTLVGRSTGFLGGGMSLDGDIDVLRGRPDEMLPYDDTEDEILDAVLGRPGMLSGRVEERDEGGELVGDTNAPRSNKPESGGVA
jgi:hypothetical protein